MHDPSATFTDAGRQRAAALALSGSIHVLAVVFFLFHGIIVPPRTLPDPDIGAELSFSFLTSTGTNEPVPSTSPAGATAGQEGRSEEVQQSGTKSELLTMLNDAWAVQNTGAQAVRSNAGPMTNDIPGDGHLFTPADEGSGQIQLIGFRVKRKPIIKDEPTASGKVVMDIWVDGNGTVIRSAQNTGLSTTLDRSLVDIAERAALDCAFYPNRTAASPQKGSITFIFELQ